MKAYIIKSDDETVTLYPLNRVAAGLRNVPGFDYDGLNLYTLLALSLQEDGLKIGQRVMKKFLHPGRRAEKVADFACSLISCLMLYLKCTKLSTGGAYGCCHCF